MKVSIVIPTKNPGPEFKKVLSAVISQAFDDPFEILIIDSGSTDGTVEYCRSMEGVRVHTIPPEEFGHGKTRNLGVALTTGEFVVFITHDALPANERWLAELVKAMELAPDVAGAFGRHLAFSDSSPLVHRDLVSHFRGFRDWPTQVVRKQDDPDRYQAEEGYRQVLHFFSSNNACIRRSVWEKHSLPEVDFAEDQVWAKEIIEAGYAKAYAHEAIVYHSHDLGVFEQLQRAFDESNALHDYFGYRLCASIRTLFYQSWKTTKRDVLYLWKSGALKNFKWLVRTPLANFNKQLGFYLGGHTRRLPQWLVNRISRDRRMKAGK